MCKCGRSESEENSVRAQWDEPIEPGANLMAHSFSRVFVLEDIFPPRDGATRARMHSVSDNIAQRSFESRRPSESFLPIRSSRGIEAVRGWRARPMIGPISVHLFQGKRPIRIPRVMGR